MKQDDELLPCPFCGSDATAPHHNRCYFDVLEALKKSRQADLSWAPGLLAAWNRRAPDARDARIAELEAELANNKETAGKLEAHGWKRVMCPGCGGDFALSSPDPNPSNSEGLQPSTPWYPDDSGEWVEVPGDIEKMPPELARVELVEVLFSGERRERCRSPFQSRPSYYCWHNEGDEYDIVAYKVVKP